jgi:hypothetical protein
LIRLSPPFLPVLPSKTGGEIRGVAVHVSIGYQYTLTTLILFVGRWNQVPANFIFTYHAVSIANTSVDTGSPEHFVEYGSKHGYTPTVKKQCLINSITAHQRWEEVRPESSEYNTYQVMK